MIAASARPEKVQSRSRKPVIETLTKAIELDPKYAMAIYLTIGHIEYFTGDHR